MGFGRQTGFVPLHRHTTPTQVTTESFEVSTAPSGWQKGCGNCCGGMMALWKDPGLNNSLNLGPWTSPKWRNFFKNSICQKTLEIRILYAFWYGKTRPLYGKVRPLYGVHFGVRLKYVFCTYLECILYVLWGTAKIYQNSNDPSIWGTLRRCFFIADPDWQTWWSKTSWDIVTLMVLCLVFFENFKFT